MPATWRPRAPNPRRGLRTERPGAPTRTPYRPASDDGVVVVRAVDVQTIHRAFEPHRERGVVTRFRPALLAISAPRQPVSPSHPSGRPEAWKTCAKPWIGHIAFIGGPPLAGQGQSPSRCASHPAPPSFPRPPGACPPQTEGRRLSGIAQNGSEPLPNRAGRHVRRTAGRDPSPSAHAGRGCSAGLGGNGSAGVRTIGD